MNLQKLRKELGIDGYLELVKEDKNCNGAYVSFGQYIYLLEREIQKLNKQLNSYKTRYINRLNNQLVIDAEPDEEDFYLAEIEGKANDYDKLLFHLQEFINYIEKHKLILDIPAVLDFYLKIKRSKYENNRH